MGRTGGPISGHYEATPEGAGVSFATHIVDAEVDPETGAAKVVRYTIAQDAGKAIHPAYVEGQFQGGAAQGIGWALNEEYIYGDDGRLQNPGFLDYRIPVASDLPMIDTVIVEVPNPGPPLWRARRRRDLHRAAARRHRQRGQPGRRRAHDGAADVAAAPARRARRATREAGGAVTRPPRLRRSAGRVRGAGSLPLHGGGSGRGWRRLGAGRRLRHAAAPTFRPPFPRRGEGRGGRRRA